MILSGKCQKVTEQPTPREISYGGGVVSIYGEGFSADTFSQFNSTKGNKIYFTNNFERVECINPVDQTWMLQDPQASSTTKVTCSMPAKGFGSEW